MENKQDNKQNMSQGFTLVEVIAVLIILSIICIAGLVRYNSMMDESRRKTATSLLASAQSQLSLEYANRLISSLDMNVASQNICDNVALSAAGATANITCTGDLCTNVAITATVDGQSANATWANPASN